jgi:hypothetical protein
LRLFQGSFKALLRLPDSDQVFFAGISIFFAVENIQDFSDSLQRQKQI